MFDLSSLNVCFMAGTLGQGGAERQLFYILKALRQSGASPHLLCLTRGEFWEAKVRELGVPVTWVGEKQSKMARLKTIISVLRKWRPDIVQSQHFYTNLYAVAAARALGLREVGAIRSDGAREVQSNGRVMGYLSLRTPRMIAANSMNAIRNAVRLGVPAARLRLLSNVVDTSQFKPAGVIEKRPVRLVAAGRLIKEKRVDRFIKVLYNMRQESPVAVKASIYGDGPQLPDLVRQARELGLLPDTVEFKGTAPDMAPVYREADIFVLTSDREGTPNVILEAMASALPVVATRVGGVSDIVRHEVNGFLADPQDEGGLKDSLLSLVQNPRLRMKMGCLAREYVEANHSLARLPSQLADIYEQAIS